MSLIDQIRQGLSEDPEPEWKRRPEILLCSQIPAPMQGLAPRVVLGDEWWNRTRLQAYKSTAYHCLACGVHKYRAECHHWLEAHEVYDTDFLLGRMVYLETVPLCHYCHNYIHAGRMKILLDASKLSRSKYASILDHGGRVLRDAGLVKTGYAGPIADWADWRLVIGDAEYPSLYRDADQWQEAMKDRTNGR